MADLTPVDLQFNYKTTGEKTSDKALKAQFSKFYLGIMHVVVNSQNSQEWLIQMQLLQQKGVIKEKETATWDPDITPKGTKNIFGKVIFDPNMIPNLDEKIITEEFQKMERDSVNFFTKAVEKLMESTIDFILKEKINEPLNEPAIRDFVNKHFKKHKDVIGATCAIKLAETLKILRKDKAEFTKEDIESITGMKSQPDQVEKRKAKAEEKDNNNKPRIR